jgi:putative sterol carrier protein
MTAKEFILALPAQVNPAALQDAQTCFHFQIAGDGGGDFTVQAKDGVCTAVEGLHDEAKCVVKCSDTLLEGIITKTENPQMAVFMGKLKISNLGEMMKYAKMFGLM